MQPYLAMVLVGFYVVFFSRKFMEVFNVSNKEAGINEKTTELLRKKE